MLKLKKYHIFSVAYIYLCLPVLIFFSGWLRLYLGLSLSALLLISLFFIIRSARQDEKGIIEIPLSVLFIAALIIFLWCILSGQGGFYYQSNDWHYRNAIFHDLINFSWPVVYPKTGAGLVYYIAHWLPAALVGKLLGWQAGNVALLFWTFTGIYLTFVLLYSFLKVDTKKKAYFLLIVLILFSGLDFIGSMYMQIRNGTPIPLHLEWWGAPSQYSSNTTQLMWVFNQSVAPWLLTVLLLNQKKLSNIGMLTVLVMPFAPLPFFGFAPIAAAIAVKRLIELIKQRKTSQILKEIFTPQNIIGLFAVFPVFYFYYTANVQAQHSGINSFDLSEILTTLIPFLLLEFLVYTLVIFKRYKNDYLFIFINLMLLIIPFIRIGEAQDFTMRASIPALFILMIYVIRFVFDEIREKKRISLHVLMIIILLTIGSITPFTEQYRAIRSIVTDGIVADVADSIKTLSNSSDENSNFLCVNPDNSFFYRYLAKQKK